MCNSDASDDATYSSTHVPLFVVLYLWLFSSSELKHNKGSPRSPLLPSPAKNKHPNLLTQTLNLLISITPLHRYKFTATFINSHNFLPLRPGRLRNVPPFPPCPFSAPPPPPPPLTAAPPSGPLLG
ncbi:hypothetical protein AMECASPLE_032831 [Ameca splendens]|uniref:Uncharacterized protein n=1 Tax=Ameca splendens TaxID=208324 RepID=A0ABV0XVP1_9TELE